MLFPQPGNGFYSLWLWEEEMEGDNTLLADTLLTLQRQQEWWAEKALEKWVLPSRIIAAGSAGFLGHEVTGLHHLLSEKGESTKWIGESNHPRMLQSLNKEQRHTDSFHLWVMDIRGNQPFTLLMTLMDSHLLPIFLEWYWVLIFIS